MEKIIRSTGYIGGALFTSSLVILIFGATYKIPDSSPLVDVFKLCFSLGSSLLLVWILLLAVRESKDF